MILVFLQNAYRYNGEGYRNRNHWLKRMWVSHTGRRLNEMLPDGVDVYVENANPLIGTKSNAEFPADLDHMKRVIDETNPRLILGCGKVAQIGLKNLGVEYTAAPHPAWRALSKKETARIRRVISRTLHPPLP